jgi:hypothetical protein
VEPLNKLNWAADSLEAQEVLEGAIPISMATKAPYTLKILKYIAEREKLLEIDTFISPTQVSKGFKKWKEETSTLPSGCHLGLRRIPAFATNMKELEKMQSSIQQIQADVINLPVSCGFSPKRWKTILNAMLEKISGKPLLHKLQVFKVLGDRQDGFRKGRSTIRTLLQNEIIHNYNKRHRINNFVGMTDISGCFDRIIPSVISMLNVKNGCPMEAVKMHADTLSQARYFLKTKNGISDTYYSHSDATPVYGNGQGAGDSPSQWSQESAMLIDLYEREAPKAKMMDSSRQQTVNVPITAFADNTNLLGNDIQHDKQSATLVAEAKHAFELWNKLLHASGHFMELGKCVCYLSIWKFQQDGYAFTTPPDELRINIEVTDIA